MALANIANVPGDNRSMAEWSFAHADHHRQITDRIKVLFNIDIPFFPIDPINIEEGTDQGYQHQEMHSAMDAVLSIAGNDLTDVDWKDEGQRSSWIWLNFIEHQQASKILGIG